MSVAVSDKWKHPSGSALRLRPGEIHVWRAQLDAVEAGFPCLSAAELAHADRFRTSALRQRFVARRTIRRQILARYLKVSPASLAFRCSRYGKPELDGGFANSPLRFNVSSSGNLALCAVAYGVDVGVDVEEMRAIPDVMELAEGFFSPREYVFLGSLAEPSRTRAFFDCWTRKEAFVKATGKGLSIPLSSFAVAFGNDEPGLYMIGDDRTAAARWTLSALWPAAGFAGALALQRRGWHERLFDWTHVPSRAARSRANE